MTIGLSGQLARQNFDLYAHKRSLTEVVRTLRTPSRGRVESHSNSFRFDVGIPK